VVNPRTPKVIRVGTPEYRLAPLGRRTVAFIIDLAIFFAVNAVIQLLAHTTETTDYYGTTHMNPAVAMLFLLWGCAFFSYWWIFDGVLPQRATIGKRAMAMQVVRTDGRPFEGRVAFGRGMARWLSFALCGLGYWWALSNPSQQAWHDKLAGTAVVDLRAKDQTTESTDLREPMPVKSAKGPA
jgi:uncharacterized RDD family membrane protein YckC